MSTRSHHLHPNYLFFVFLISISDVSCQLVGSSSAAALPTAHGFDSYFGIPYSVDMGYAYGNRTEESWSEGDYYGCTPLPLLANTSVVEQPVNLATLNARYTANAVDFIQREKNSDAPFFLYFAFGHVHTPQYAGVEQAGKSKRGIFGDSIAEVDASIGAVLSAIGDSNVIVFMSSDNGAPDAHQHLQPGQELHTITGSNYMFLGSKTQTWEGGIREPGIVWWPGKIQPQVRLEVVSTMDIFASVADLAGVPLPGDGRVYDTTSLMPLLTGATAVPPRNASFFYAGATLQAVRLGPYKAHLVTQLPNEPHAGPERGFLKAAGFDHSPYGKQSPWLVFNLERDPAEQYPLHADTLNKRGILAALQSVVAAHLAQLGTPPQGVLDVPCATDCRVCCDHTKNCMCNAPPADRTSLSSSGEPAQFDVLL